MKRPDIDEIRRLLAKADEAHHDVWDGLMAEIEEDHLPGLLEYVEALESYVKNEVAGYGESLERLVKLTERLVLP